MHSRDLAELALQLVVQHSVFVESTTRVSSSGLVQYWTASKCRSERWCHAFKNYEKHADVAEGKLRTLLWLNLRPVLEEILISELLTRVWTAAVGQHDRRHEEAASEPIVRSVYSTHLEARHRTLKLLVSDRNIDPHELVELNRLRRQCENWTDVLLAWLGDAPLVAEMSFHPDRTRQFAGELREERGTTAAVTRSQLTAASLRASFAAAPRLETPNHELNAQIAAAVLACFPAELFDSTGRFKSLWQVRMEHTTSDTEGLISELLAVESPAAAGHLRRF